MARTQQATAVVFNQPATKTQAPAPAPAAAPAPAPLVAPPAPKSALLPGIGIGTPVICRLYTGSALSVPDGPRLLYVVSETNAGTLLEIQPLSTDIWIGVMGMGQQQQAQTQPTQKPTNNAVDYHYKKDLMNQRKDTTFKKLPTNGRECMSFHDDMFVLLACRAWKTKSGQHILEATKDHVVTLVLLGDVAGWRHSSDLTRRQLHAMHKVQMFCNPYGHRVHHCPSQPRPSLLRASCSIIV